VSVALAVALTMAASVTLLPAMLGFLGLKVLRRAERGTLVRRLERAGLVRTRWSGDGGRHRRVYELTQAGRAMLAAERHARQEFAAAVSALLGPRQVTE
jgi:predicted ArsR family transcriptional regulator